MLTKKNYRAIAEILKTQGKETVNYPGIEAGNYVAVSFSNLVYSLCDYFKQDNPNFDERRFRKALSE